MKSVLILDDNKNGYINNIIKGLQFYGINVFYEKNTTQATECIKSNKNISIIIIDLMMPHLESTSLPDDCAEVGFKYFLDIYESDFKGHIIILTNAKPEQHRAIFEKISSIIKISDRIKVFYKPDSASLSVVDYIKEQIQCVK